MYKPSGPLLIYIATFLVSSTVAVTAYLLLPQYRGLLLLEDSFVENTTALLFAVCAFAAFISCGRAPGKKLLLIGVGLLALLGFLEELSFGERLLGLSMPYVMEVKLDAFHDLVELAFTFFKRQARSSELFIYVLVAFGVLVLAVVFWHRRSLLRWTKSLVVDPGAVFLVIFALLIGVSLIIDLDIVHYQPLFLLEEMLELNAALSLIFYVWVLRN